MLNRFARHLVTLISVCALGCAVGASAAGAVTVGISDNTTGMFSSHYFNDLNISNARLIVQWDAAVLRNKSALNSAKTWVQTAVADKVTPMISFTSDPHGIHVPTLSQYTKAVKAFMRAVPQVRIYSPWDEPDWVYLPLSHEPRLAASFFNVMVQNCKHCTVLAGEFYLPAGPQLANYIKAYKAGLRYKPKIWAFHNYYDVRSHTTSQLRMLESLTSGQIWLTEISGVERRGHWQYKNQSVFAAAKDESFLFSLPKKFHRITRIYHYQWQGTIDTKDTGWDSGLLGPAGVPRPAYWVVAKAAGPRHTTRR
jgi:Glycosyl hydrolase catalytic core